MTSDMAPPDVMAASEAYVWSMLKSTLAHAAPSLRFSTSRTFDVAAVNVIPFEQLASIRHGALAADHTG
jgi:hypothetical protein